MTDEQAEKVVDLHVMQLLEYFDSVRIFATLNEGEAKFTHGISRGGGNFYAQLGLVSDWIKGRDEETRIDTRAEVERGEDE